MTLSDFFEELSQLECVKTVKSSNGYVDFFEMKGNRSSKLKIIFWRGSLFVDFQIEPNGYSEDYPESVSFEVFFDLIKDANCKKLFLFNLDLFS